jgi:rod shape-determining protein MreD
MRYWLALPLLLTAALLQSAVMPSFPIFGATPNLVLIILVSWVVQRGQKEGLFVIPLGGLALGLVDGQPLGVALLAATPLILLAELREARLTESDILLSIVLVFVSAMVYETVFLVTLALRGETVQWWESFFWVVLPVSIVSSLFTPPLYWLVHWVSRDIRRARSL